MPACHPQAGAAPDKYTLVCRLQTGAADRIAGVPSASGRRRGDYTTARRLQAGAAFGAGRGKGGQCLYFFFPEVAQGSKMAPEEARRRPQERTK